MALDSFCPGSRLIRQPIPEDVTCIYCGAEVEIWSFESVARCPSCGHMVCRDQGPSCLDWCKAAKECVGPEMYERIMAQRKAAAEPGKRNTRPVLPESPHRTP